MDCEAGKEGLQSGLVHGGNLGHQAGPPPSLDSDSFDDLLPVTVLAAAKFGGSPWCRCSEPECCPHVEREGRTVEHHVRLYLVPRGAAAQCQNVAHTVALNCEEDGWIAMNGPPAAFACRSPSCSGSEQECCPRIELRGGW
jgi:hypothetical protein